MSHEPQSYAPAPFPQLQIPPMPVEAPPGKGKRRGPRRPKELAALSQEKPKRKRRTAPLSLEAVARRPRQSAITRPPRKPRAVKIDLAIAMAALSSLSEDEGKVLMSFIQTLQPHGKKSRERVVAALAKMVAP